MEVQCVLVMILLCHMIVSNAVFVPPGQYAFMTNTTVTVPRGVTIQGTYR